MDPLMTHKGTGHFRHFGRDNRAQDHSCGPAQFFPVCLAGSVGAVRAEVLPTVLRAASGRSGSGNPRFTLTDHDAVDQNDPQTSLCSEAGL